MIYCDAPNCDSPASTLAPRYVDGDVHQGIEWLHLCPCCTARRIEHDSPDPYLALPMVPLPVDFQAIHDRCLEED